MIGGYRGPGGCVLRVHDVVDGEAWWTLGGVRSRTHAARLQRWLDMFGYVQIDTLPIRAGAMP